MPLKTLDRGSATQDRLADTMPDMTAQERDKYRPHPGADAWRFRDPKDLDWIQRMFTQRAPFVPPPSEFTVPTPTGKIPVVSVWREYAALGPYIIMPTVFRALFMWLTGCTVPIYVMYPILVVHINRFMPRMQARNRNKIMKYGYLDANIARDGVPEGHTTKLFMEMLNGSLGRPLLFLLLAYNRYEMPQITFWMPLQMTVLAIVLDFVYYWVHRTTHEVEWMWAYHKRHHTTKHPNPFLLAYADEIQEIFDAYISIGLAYLFFPVSFDVLYIWALFWVAMEAAGHGGFRLYYPGLLTFGLLRPFQCDIIVEDHDLHHRFGWRSSYNYGKETMLWDQLFGTKAPRLETADHLVDWNHVADC